MLALPRAGGRHRRGDLEDQRPYPPSMAPARRALLQSDMPSRAPGGAHRRRARDRSRRGAGRSRIPDVSRRGLLSAEACDPRRAIRPFSGNSANAFGEGAVTLVLETRSHAEARKATGFAELVAYRYGNGGDHPDGRRFHRRAPGTSHRRRVRRRPDRQRRGGLRRGSRNGVPVSDISELNYMKRVFGAGPARCP